MTEILGVDFGNVIINHVGFGTTSDFVRTGDYNIIPPVSGVFEALRHLNQERFAGNIFVVYNASDATDQKILSWLKSHDFFNRTDIYPARVMRTKNGRNKSSECDRYKATHFIDDRLEALSYLVCMVKDLYLFRSQQKEVEQYKNFLPHVRQAMSWSEIIRLLLI